MFKLQSNRFFEGTSIGYAVVFMDRNYHASMVEFIYQAETDPGRLDTNTETT